MLELGILSRESVSEENSLNWTIPWPGMMGNWSDWFTTLFVFVCNHTWFVNRGAELIIIMLKNTVLSYIQYVNTSRGNQTLCCILQDTEKHTSQVFHFLLGAFTNIPSPLSSLEN